MTTLVRGRCSEVMVALGTPFGCDLPHGHLGQHHDTFTGAHWTPGNRPRRLIGRILIALGEWLS